MVPGSVGSKASVKPSVTPVARLIHRSWIGVTGQGQAKRDGDDDGAHFAAIGRQRPLDHLAEIVVDRAPLALGGDDRGETVVGEHNLRRLLGRFRALPAHGHADIGALQGRRVVHAVAGHGRHGVTGLQRRHEAQFVRRAGAGEHRGLARDLHQRLVVEPVDVLAGHDLRIVGEVEQARDRPRRRRMVAGDHLHVDAGRAAMLDRGESFLARRIDQPEQAEHGGAVLDIGEVEVAPALRHLLDRHGQDAHALACDGFGARPPEIRIQGSVAVGLTLPAAHGEHALRRALDIGEGPAVMAVMQRGHELVLRIEGNFVGARELLGEAGGIVSRLDAEAHQGALHGIAHDEPDAVGLPELGVVTEKGRARGVLKRRLVGRLDQMPAGLEAAFGPVSHA
jgi:hypothetical protein